MIRYVKPSTLNQTPCKKPQAYPSDMKPKLKRLVFSDEKLKKEKIKEIKTYERKKQNRILMDELSYLYAE